MNTYGHLCVFVSGIVNRTNRTGTGTGAAIVAIRGEKNTCELVCMLSFDIVMGPIAYDYRTNRTGTGTVASQHSTEP